MDDREERPVDLKELLLACAIGMPVLALIPFAKSRGIPVSLTATAMLTCLVFGIAIFRWGSFHHWQKVSVTLFALPFLFLTTLLAWHFYIQPFFQLSIWHIVLALSPCFSYYVWVVICNEQRARGRRDG